MTAAEASQHQITIPSVQKQLKKAVAFIEGLAQQAGFDEDAIVDIAISVSEAVNNAIIHGNRKDKNKKVQILVDLKKDLIKVRVRDQAGSCFSPANICNPLEPDNLMKCNGRGILIQRALMDEVNFRTAPSGGTEVELIKKLGKSDSKGKK